MVLKEFLTFVLEIIMPNSHHLIDTFMFNFYKKKKKITILKYKINDKSFRQKNY